MRSYRLLPLTLLVLACERGASPTPSASAPAGAALTDADGSSWAYGFATPPDTSQVAAAPGGTRGGSSGGNTPARTATSAPVDTTRYTIDGSTRTFTSAEIRDAYGPADWFPGDHPAMPPIVANGRRDANIMACSLCHYPNGKGRPENAGVSGLPVSYFVQTLHDFRSELRRSSDPRKANTNRMIAFAKAMTEEEIMAAAEYFAAMPWTPWIQVVEQAEVPKTRIAAGLFIPLEGADAGVEPIGRRIIEVPENTGQAERRRNPRSGFVAYVPPGSLAKGEALVARAQCTVCHGPTLEGLGPVPGIAGRSPSYLARQLFDMQNGARKGEWSALMYNAVSALGPDDVINVSAYVASLGARREP